MTARTETSEQVAPRHGLFEPLAFLLLSLGTVGTAWCSFEAASWGAAAQGTMNQSTALSRRAAMYQLQSYQTKLLDVILFSEYVNARAGSNDLLASFYADRFRGEAKTAFTAWLGSRPFENPQAFPHPFVTNLYQPQLLADAVQAEEDAARLAMKAGEAGRISRMYILITVLLACALFCGGSASKFEKPLARRAVLALGLAALLFAGQRFLQLPVQL